MESLSLTEEYLKTLTEKELKAYEIAKDHLGSSFELEKSVGYLKWLGTKTNAEKKN
jgi:hypothetical protein